MGRSAVTVLRKAALDARRYAPGMLAALAAAIDVNDRVGLDATSSGPIGLDHSPDRFVEGFCLSRQFWQNRFDATGLAAFAAALRRGDSVDATAREWFKQVRAAFKHLRFAFFLYSIGHRAPPLLSLTTLVMGELQDAIRVRGSGDVRRHALRLQVLLTGPTRLLLTRETDRLVPSDTEGFRRFTLSQVASVRPLLSQSTIGAHAFHAARKVVSRQVSFHDDMRTLYPFAERAVDHRAMARWLATLNGLMGQFHDDLVARDAGGAFDYRRDAIVLPDAIRMRLEALVDSYLGTSSSNPPLA